MKGPRFITVFVLSLVALAVPAEAVVLSVDPTSATIDPGGSVGLDINISGLGDFASPSLGGFDITIGFDDTILGFDSAAMDPGLFLGDPGLFQALVFLDGPNSFVEVSLLPSAVLNALQPSSFTVVSLSFTGLAPGTTTVAIGATILSDELGVALPIVKVNAAVTVTPAPGAALLALIGLGMVNRMRRRTV